MHLSNQNIMFFTRTMRLGGTENVILQMCEVLQPYVNKIVVCSCGGINVEKLNNMGIKHYEIPDIDSKKPGVIYKVFREVPRIIKEEKITIVHTHHRMATFYMFFINKLFHLKVVSTLHGTFSDKRLLTSMVYKNIPIISCGVVAKKSFVNNYHINPKHIKVIRNAIKKEEVNIEQLECLKTLPDDYKKIAYVGRLSEEKGINILIDAISLVKRRDEKIFFVIAGTGDLESEMKDLVKQEQIMDIVEFLGYRNDPQNIISQVDATVLPSFTEGLPLTPIESFAQGKPIIATRVGGTVEIVKNNINGVLVPPGSKELLAEGIIKLFQDKEKYDQMCKAALKTYEDKFSFRKFEIKLVDFYENLCGDGNLNE